MSNLLLRFPHVAISHKNRWLWLPRLRWENFWSEWKTSIYLSKNVTLNPSNPLRHSYDSFLKVKYANVTLIHFQCFSVSFQSHQLILWFHSWKSNLHRSLPLLLLLAVAVCCCFLLLGLKDVHLLLHHRFFYKSLYCIEILPLRWLL